MAEGVFRQEAESGVLFNRTADRGRLFRSFGRAAEAAPDAVIPEAETTVASHHHRGAHRLAFAGVWFFTLLLYLRPNELFADTLGFFPIVKYTAMATLLAYFVSKLALGERLMIWPIEMKALAVIVLLGLLFTPVAESPQDSLSTLFDTFLKVVTIFVLLINLLDSLARLRAIITLVVALGTIISLAAIRSYLVGDFVVTDKGVGVRIAGLVGGIFGNPNDLANGLNLLLPLALALALTSRGWKRVLWLGCAGLLLAGVVVTFSRGGFLGLLALGLVLLWKLSRDHRAGVMGAALVLMVLVLFALPGQYGSRMRSIINIQEDPTGSAQARRELLVRAADLASRHLVFGVGMGNYHIYSLHEKAAHNSWLEISTELGVVGLLAYCLLIFAPLRSLRRIERGTRREARADDDERRQLYYFSIALQAVLVSYIVCSTFGSIQYLWFLYYPVAYAVALRGLYRSWRERADAVPAAEPDETAGTIWRSRTSLTQGQAVTMRAK